ncbi:conserved hypothetical protein [Burkholderiales bacterium 8X]|nr:conserved hypothetical protein [Burkholderiales bacterium 8X]
MNPPERGILVSITRKLFDASPWYGVFVAASELFVVIQQVSQRFDLDGYRVFRRADIADIDASFEGKTLIETALFIKGLTPSMPYRLDLSGMRELVESVQRQFGVMVIHREQLQPCEVEIGTVRLDTDHTYVLRWLTPHAEWSDDDRLFHYRDISMLEFGGEYERTLLMVASAKQTARS